MCTLSENCGAYENIPNLCVVQKVCTGCMDKETPCNRCEKREQGVSGDNILNAFCEWLFSDKKLPGNCSVPQLSGL